MSCKTLGASAQERNRCFVEAFPIRETRQSFDACFYKKTSGKNKRKEQAGKIQASKTLANKEQIVSYVQKQNGAGSSEIAAQIELSIARTRVLLAELISEGRIYAEGNGRARKYYAIE